MNVGIKTMNCFLFLVINGLAFTNGLIKSQQLLNGNLTVAGLFEVQTVRSDGNCGEVLVGSVMPMEAVRWYLQSVNDNKSLPFKLGFSVYKTCGNLGHAGDAAVDIISKYRQSYTELSSEDVIIGVIGPEYSSETQVVSSILGSQTTSDRLLQIGFSATSTELNDRAKYSNYYRVVVNDGVQITAMLKLMYELKWNRIAIIYVNDTYGRVGANMLHKYSEEYHICISKMNAIEIDESRQIEAAKIREILNNYIIEAPSIEGLVYFGNKEIAKQVMKIFDNLKMSDVPIFILSESNLGTDVFKSETGNLFSKAKGTLAVTVPYIESSAFKAYWESLFTNKTALQLAAKDNPYLKDVFRQYKGCDFDYVNCEALDETEIAEKASQSVYVHYALFAAHTFIEVLTKYLETSCIGGCNTISDFKAQFSPNHLIEAMNGLTVAYDGSQASFDESSSNAKLSEDGKKYEVYNFRKAIGVRNEFTYVNVGDLSGETLVLELDKIKDYSPDGTENNYPDVRRGQCPIGQKCIECIGADIPEISYHIPGDFYVVGIISINNRAIPGPLGCGTTRERHGYQMYLALQFTLEQFQKRSWYAHYKEMFAGKSIGLVVINSCNNALEIVPKILELHAKGLQLADGTHLDLTKRILGYVGGQAADVSEPAASQLTKLNFIQLSYSTTNPVLSNKDLYPYFLRIISPDNLQAKAMIDIVKELGGEYIQLLYSEGAYGEGGRDAVLAAAESARICVIQTIMVNEKEIYYDYYQKMLVKPHARIVILFLRSHVVGPFLRDLNRNMNRGQFHFIGSEAWGKNKDALTYDITKGAIVTAVEMDKNRDLEQFIKQQKAEYNASNPWFENYLQSRQNCYFRWSYDKTFDRECSDDILPNNDPTFESDPWCIFVSNAMFAFLKGAAVFYSNQCGYSSVNRLCDDFVNKPLEFFKVLRTVKVDIYGTGEIPVFDEKGDGLMGYHIYNIQDGPLDKTMRVYSQIGSYDATTGLQIDKTRLTYPQDRPVTSVCLSDAACDTCIPDENTDQDCGNNCGEASVVLPVVLGTLIALLVIVVVVLSVLLWLKTKPKPDELYLSPTYLDQRPATEGQMESDFAYISADPSVCSSSRGNS